MQGLPVHVTESPYELTRAEHDSLLHNLAPCTSKDRSNGAFRTRICVWMFYYGVESKFACPPDRSHGYRKELPVLGLGQHLLFLDDAL